MRVTWLWSLLLIVCLTLAVSGAAWAHVEVSPEKAPAGSSEEFAFEVPAEKDVPTTRVRIEAPEGFSISGAQPVSGWKSSLEEEGGVATAVTWSGGEIAPDQSQEFALRGAGPEETGEFAWKAFQTYEDGSVVEWTDPEDSEEPAPVLRVVADGAPSDEAGAGSHGQGAADSGSHPEDTLPDSGGIDPAIFYGGLGLGVLAMGAAVLMMRAVARRA